MKYIIHANPSTYDHDDIRFIQEDGTEARGYGFIPRDGDKTIALVKCPMCGRENYAMNVATGQCSWCPFNANAIPHANA